MIKLYEIRTALQKYCLGKVQYWALDADTLNYTLLNQQINGQIVNENEKGILLISRLQKFMGMQKPVEHIIEEVKSFE